MSLRPSVLSLLLLVVVVSAICVVFSKHQARKLFIELQSLEKARDAMDVEWGQLQLEQSTLTTQGQVEVAAVAEGEDLGEALQEGDVVGGEGGGGGAVDDQAAAVDGLDGDGDRFRARGPPRQCRQPREHHQQQ